MVVLRSRGPRAAPPAGAVPRVTVPRPASPRPASPRPASPRPASPRPAPRDGRLLPGRGQLRDDREAGLGREARRLARRPGHHGPRAGYPQVTAQREQGVLAGHLPGQIRGRLREQVPAAQRVPLLGQEDRARIVGRDEHRPAAEAAGQVEQPGLDPFGRFRPGLPEHPPGQVAGVRRGSPPSLMHPVHRHAEPPEAAGHPEGAVVQRVGVQLEHHRGGAHVGVAQVAEHGWRLRPPRDAPRRRTGTWRPAPGGSRAPRSSPPLGAGCAR